MSIDIKDQPRESFFSYDVTDVPYNMKAPYVPPKRGIGAPEVISFVIIVGLAYIVLSWLAQTIAGFIA